MSDIVMNFFFKKKRQPVATRHQSQLARANLRHASQSQPATSRTSPEQPLEPASAIGFATYLT